MRTEKLGCAQDVIVTEALPRKKSWWTVILLSNLEKFCPWSLIKKKKKDAPSHLFFLCAAEICQRSFWSFYHSPEQAQRCSVCLGCALEFRSYILMLIRPTSSLWPAVCCFLFLCNPCQYYKMTYSLSRKTLEYTKWSVEWVLPVFWQDNKWNTCAIQSKQVCGKDFSV